MKKHNGLGIVEIIVILTILIIFTLVFRDGLASLFAWLIEAHT